MSIATNLGKILKTLSWLVLLLANAAAMQVYGQNTAVDSLKRGNTITVLPIEIGSMQGLDDQAIIDMLIDKQGYTWLCTDKGIYLYNGFSCEVIRPTKILGKGADDFIEKVIMAKPNVLWFMSKKKQVIEYNQNISKWSFGHYDTFDSLIKVDSVATLKDKNKWYLGKEFQEQLKKLLACDSIWTMQEDKDGNIWISTEKFGKEENSYELLTLNLQTKTIHKVIAANFNLSKINLIRFDIFGNVLLSSWGKGLLLISKEQLLVSFFTTTSQPKIVNNRVWATAATNTHLYVGSANDGGLTIINLKSWQQEIFRKPQLCDNDVFEVLIDKKQNLWVGTSNGLCLRKSGEKTFRFYLQNIDVNTSKIWELYEDSNGTIWVGTYAGLYRYDTIIDKFELVNYKPKGEKQDKIWVITENYEKDKLWVSTYQNGLFHISKTGELLAHYKNNPDNNFSLTNDRISAIVPLNANELCIGTYGGGCQIFTLDNQKFTMLKDKKNLITDEVYDIFDKGNGELIIVSDEVLVYNLRTRTAKAPYYEGQIKQDNYNVGAASYQNRQLWAGRSFGVKGIKIDTLPQQNRELFTVAFDKLFIEDTLINPTSNGVLQKPLSSTKYIEVGYANNFALSFVTNSSAPNKRIEFFYTLNNNKLTKVSNTTQEIHFDELAFNFFSSHYVLTLYAKDKAGILNEAKTTLFVRIQPPFWATWWFLLGFFVLMVFVITYIYRREKQIYEEKIIAQQQIYNVKQELQAKESEKLQVENQAHQQKMMELEAKSQRTGSQLHGSKNELLMVYDQLKDIAPQAAQQISRVAAVIRNVSETNYPPDIANSIEQLLQIKIASNEAAFAQKGIKCYPNFMVENSTVIDKEIKHSLYRVLEEVLSNVYKHSEATEVHLNLFTDEKMLLLSIEDNGKGFDEAMVHKNIGFQEYDNYMYLVKGSYDISSEVGRGTMLTFKVPLT